MMSGTCFMGGTTLNGEHIFVMSGTCFMGGTTLEQHHRNCVL